MRVLEKRVLTRKFRPKRGEETGELTISFKICKVSEVNNAPFFRVELHHVERGLFRLDVFCIIRYTTLFQSSLHYVKSIRVFEEKELQFIYRFNLVLRYICGA
jgi:hypothetical protein